MDVDVSTISSLLKPDRLLVGLLIVVGAVILSRTSTRLLDRWGEGAAKRRLLFKRVASILRFVIFLVGAVLVVTNVMDLSNEAMMALTGTVAVAVGFAMKDTTASLISGVLILIDQPFQVGDWITFGGTYGEVKEIGLRSVRIETKNRELVSIPTNKFLTDAVSSANAGELHMMVVMDFFIDASADFDLAMELVREATLTSPYVYLNKPVRMRLADVEAAGDFVTRVRAKAYVFDARFDGRMKSDVTARAKRAFREHGISGPTGRLHVEAKSVERFTGMDA